MNEWMNTKHGWNVAAKRAELLYENPVPMPASSPQVRGDKQTTNYVSHSTACGGGRLDKGWTERILRGFILRGGVAKVFVAVSVGTVCNIVRTVLDTKLNLSAQPYVQLSAETCSILCILFRFQVM